MRAPAWLRVAAFLIEALLALAFGWYVAGPDPQAGSTVAAAVAALLLWGAIDALATARLGGTPAQVALGLRVERAGGGRLRLGEAISRQLLVLVDVLFGLFVLAGVGYGVQLAYENARPGSTTDESSAVALALAGALLLATFLAALVGGRPLHDRPGGARVLHRWSHPLGAAAPGGAAFQRLAMLLAGITAATTLIGISQPRALGIGPPDHDTADPLQAVTVGAHGLTDTDTVTARFFDASGFELTVPALRDSATTVLVSVPPYLTPSDHALALDERTVKVQLLARSAGALRASNSVDLRIRPLPTAAAPAGALATRFVDLTQTIARAARARLSGVTDAAALDAALGTMVEVLEPGRSDGAKNAAAGRVTEFDVLADRFLAAQLLALGPHSPSPCAEKDPSTSSIIGDPIADPGTAIGDAVKQRSYSGAVLSCAGDQLLRYTQVMAAGLAAIGAVALIGRLDVPIILTALATYIIMSTLVVSVVSLLSSATLFGRPEDAEKAGKALDDIFRQLMDAGGEGLTRIVVPAFGPVYALWQATRAVEQVVGERVTGLANAERIRRGIPTPTPHGTPTVAPTRAAAPAVSAPRPAAATAAPPAPVVAPPPPAAPAAPADTLAPGLSAARDVAGRWSGSFTFREDVTGAQCTFGGTLVVDLQALAATTAAGTVTFTETSFQQTRTPTTGIPPIGCAGPVDKTTRLNVGGTLSSSAITIDSGGTVFSGSFTTDLMSLTLASCIVQRGGGCTVGGGPWTARLSRGR